MRILRVLLIIVVVIVVLVVIAVGAVYALSNQRLNQTFAVSPISVTVPELDEESAAEAERLWVTRGCGDCHGDDGAGVEVINFPPLAVVYGSNLTAGEGGVRDQYDSSEDWVGAITHGVSPDGRGLLVMPSKEYSHFSETDLSLLIAHMESFEPVDANHPEPSVGPLGRVLYLTGELNAIEAELIDHDAVTPINVAPEVSLEYGEYLILNCTGCHGQNLAGGNITGGDPNWPPASNITPHATGIGDYTLDDFITLMQRGTKPDGSQVLAPMPWQAYGQLTQTELEAMWLYLQQVEPVPYPGE